MEPVRIGLVGYGFGGRWFHAPLLRAAVECDFLGVVTSSPERRALVDPDHPGLPTFDSLEALRPPAPRRSPSPPPPRPTARSPTGRSSSGSPSSPTSRSRSTPPPRSARSSSPSGSGLPLSPYQNRRWDSDFLTVRALAADGTLGELTRFESRFERLDPDPGRPPSGGGTLRDFGSHLVDQALCSSARSRRSTPSGGCASAVSTTTSSSP